MNILSLWSSSYSTIQESPESSEGETSPRSVDEDPSDSQHQHLTKSFGLFDLLCVGVGATVGSGVFVLTGLVAREVAGPGVVMSWLIAGCACCLSATAFAELSSRFPSSTSSYSFAKHTLGEWFAYLAAWGLTLECGLSAAAVARSWGRKLINLIESTGTSHLSESTDEWGFNFPAFILQLLVVFLFLAGKDVSKTIINVFTVAKVLLIVFMIVMGLYLFDVKNFEPSLTPMGWGGVLRGATMCFFGFVGYDEVCCLALETKHARRLMPQAVFGTIAIVCVLYGLSSIALVGMANYTVIDSENGFAKAFLHAGYPFAAVITATGEMVMLPLVVILSFLPQPRILAALARDRLAPVCLATVSESGGGNLVHAILVSGLVATVVAAFVPFIVLNDLISAGVLLSFNVTNTALILVRCDATQSPLHPHRERHLASLPSVARQHTSSSRSLSTFLSSFVSFVAYGDRHKPFHLSQCQLSRCQLFVCLYHLAAIVFAASIATYDREAKTHQLSPHNRDTSWIATPLLAMLGLMTAMYFFCPDQQDLSATHTASVYRTPWVPLIPLLGIGINTLLIFQLSATGLWVFVGYVCVATSMYLLQKLLVFIGTERDEEGAAVETPVCSHMHACVPTAREHAAVRSKEYELVPQ